MARGKPTRLYNKGEVIAFRKIGMSFRAIARQAKLPKSTVMDICTRYFNTGAVECMPHTGRPKMTSPREDRALVKISLKKQTTDSTTT